jgi:hypothetical protein
MPRVGGRLSSIVLMQRKLPSFQFYPGDWLKDPDLRRCPLAARGLCIDLLCFMHESDERGVLTSNGKPILENELGNMFGGADNKTITHLASVLCENGVFSRRESDGAIFSRRMVSEEKIRKARSDAGKAGMGSRWHKKKDNKTITKTGSSSSSSSSCLKASKKTFVQCSDPALLACLQKHGIEPRSIVPGWIKNGWGRLIRAEDVDRILEREPQTAGPGARVNTLQAGLALEMPARKEKAKREAKKTAAPCAWCATPDVPKVHTCARCEEELICGPCSDAHLRKIAKDSRKAVQ